MKMEDLKDCIVTFNQCKEKLYLIELKLAKYFNLNKENIHESILNIANNSNLFDDILIDNEYIGKNWYQEYSLYLSFIEDEIDINITNYSKNCDGLSFINTKNENYKNILSLKDKFLLKEIIPILVKYINEHHWLIFGLLRDLIGNLNNFPKEAAGKLMEVQKYWIKRLKKENYIHD